VKQSPDARPRGIPVSHDLIRLGGASRRQTLDHLSDLAPILSSTA